MEEKKLREFADKQGEFQKDVIKHCACDSSIIYQSILDYNKLNNKQ